MISKHLHVLFIAIGLIACAAEARPDAAGDTAMVPPPPTTCSQSSCTNGNLPSGDGGLADGDDEPIGPALCDGLTQDSQNVVEYETIFPPDAAKGGAIDPGIYVLHSVDRYVASTSGGPDAPPARATTTLVKATIIIGRKAMRWIRATGTDDGQDGQFGPDEVHADTYVLDGTTITSTSVCPTAGTKGSVRYSVSGNLLTLRLSDTETETYLRKTF